ncbi:MAG: O-antigen ligase family protein [Bacillota bacterium]
MVKLANKIDWIFQSIIYSAALLLIMTPLFKGTFFPSAQYKALIFVSLLFFLVLYDRNKNGETSLRINCLDILILALPIIYLLSMLKAANYGLALTEVVKYTLYCLTYFVAKHISAKSGPDFLLRAIFISSVIVSLVGFFSAAGIVEIRDSFYSNRISSSLQYPNALACYLGAAVLPGMYLWAKSNTGIENRLLKKVPEYYFYNVGIYIVLAALAGTRSVGGLAVFAVAFTILLLLSEFRTRLLILVNMILVGAVSFFTAKKALDSLISDGKGPMVWLWLLLGLIAVVFVQYMLTSTNKRFSDKLEGGKKIINYFLASSLTLAVVVTGWYISALDFGGRFITGVYRVDYLRDALKMYLDRPLLGWGGGAWEDIYRLYQEYLYNTTQVHSFIGQVAVETGTMGLVAVAGIWFAFLLAAVRLYRSMEEKGPVAAVAASALMIGLHSALDFDLSLSAIALVLWAVFGIASGMASSLMPGKSVKGEKLIPALSVLTAVILTASFCLAVSDSMFKSAYPKDLRGMESAINLNPLNSRFNYLLARTYFSLNEKEKSLEKAKRAVELATYDVNYRMLLSSVALATGDNGLAYENAEKALKYSPMTWTTYENYSRVCYSIGLEKLKAGDKKSARELFVKTLSVNDKLVNQINSLTEDKKKKWEGGVLPAPTDLMILTAGAASVFLGDLDMAFKNMEKVTASRDKSFKSQAILWLSALNNDLGYKDKSTELLNQAVELDPAAIKHYETISSMVRERV